MKSTFRIIHCKLHKAPPNIIFKVNQKIFVIEMPSSFFGNFPNFCCWSAMYILWCAVKIVLKIQISVKFSILFRNKSLVFIEKSFSWLIDQIVKALCWCYFHFNQWEIKRITKLHQIVIICCLHFNFLSKW